jgi:hypothetical protein
VISCALIADAVPDIAFVATDTPALLNTKLVSDVITLPIDDCSVVVVVKSPVPETETAAIPRSPAKTMPSRNPDLRFLFDVVMAFCMVL